MTIDSNAIVVFVATSESDAKHAPEGSRIVRMTSDAPAAVIEAVRNSGVTAADLRSSAVVATSPDASARSFAACYVALAVIAGRRLAVQVAGRTADMASLDEKLRALTPSRRPQDPDMVVQVGAEHPSIESVSLSEGDVVGSIERIRHAKVVRVATGDDPIALVASVVAVAAIRRRPDQERFPLLVDGAERFNVDDEVHAGLNLDTVQRGASVLRRNPQQVKPAVTEKAAVSERLVTLHAANSLPIEDVMVLLGGRRGDETEPVWHCPRPTRHTNGDQVPSMKTSAGVARCMRCDAEKVGPVRLAADVLGVSPDEAAEFLLAKLA